MTTVIETGRCLASRSSRRGEASIRREFVRRLFECLAADSHSRSGNSADVTGFPLFRNGPSPDHHLLKSHARGLAGSAEGLRGVRCGVHLQRDPQCPERSVCALVRTGVWMLRRSGAGDPRSRCAGRRLRAGHVEGSRRRVEGAEKVRRGLTAGPISDTPEGRERPTARRAEAAAGVSLTAREFQLATPPRDLTTALARTDDTPNPCSQHPKTGSQRPKNELATTSRHVATLDRSWADTAKRLTAARSGVAATNPRRTARAGKLATSGNLLAASNENPVPALQVPLCASFSTPSHEGGHRE
jgi:hypothetical protein